MINIEKEEKIYEGVIAGKELTTKELNNYGFNSKDIAKLIDEGILKRVKRGLYSFQDVEKLFYYGKKLISFRQYDKATRCFEKCHELDPNHNGVCFQLFMRKIRTFDYAGALEYFEKITQTDNKFYIKDSNFYLFLLNLITDLPEPYRSQVNYMIFEDIEIDPDDKRYKNIEAHNKIRSMVFNLQLSRAASLLDVVINEKGGLSVQEIIIRDLINQARKKQNKIKSEMLSLFHNKKYDELISLLEELDAKGILPIGYKYSLQLVKDLKDLIDTGKIPNKKFYPTKNFFSAIDGKNYGLALILITNHLKETNLNANNNLNYLLVLEITEVIKRLTKQKELEARNFELVQEEVIESLEPSPVQEVVETLEPSPVQEVVETQEPSPVQEVVETQEPSSVQEVVETLEPSPVQEVVETLEPSPVQEVVESLEPSSVQETAEQLELKQFQKTDYPSKLFVDIINFLMQNDFDKANNSIRAYLKTFNQDEYEFLIEKLIKISLIEKDKSFAKPMAALMCISRRKFIIDITEFIKYFYAALFENEFEKAKNYLDILIKYSKKGQIIIRTDSLEQMLNDAMINQPKEYRAANQIENLELPSQVIVQNKEPESTNPVITKSDFDTTIAEENKTDIDSNTSNFDYESFMEEKVNELKANGIVILTSLSKDKRQKICEMVKNIPFITTIVIEENGNFQIALVFTPSKDENIDYLEISNEGKQAYYLRDYDLCIEKYRQLIEHGYSESVIYGKIGISYMKKYNKPLAIAYLTVAKEMARIEKNDTDFDDILTRLKKGKSKNFKDMIPFKDNLDYNYGINNLDQILKLMSSGLSLFEACQKFNLDNDKTCIVAIIIAKNYYAVKNNKLGEKYLRIAEGIKGKSDFTNCLLDEVRQNKRFYVNRVASSKRILIP